jgi:rRNA pseudouridine-1189 N-methylase Emg1 (Nep1/Mra1 family)
MSSDSPTVRLSSYVKTLPDDTPIVFFIGAMARGEDNWVDDIVDEKISVSEYPLSASVTCGKLVYTYLLFLVFQSYILTYFIDRHARSKNYGIFYSCNK